MRVFLHRALAVVCLLGLCSAAVPPPPATAQVMKQASDLIEWGRWKEARGLVSGAVNQPNPAPPDLEAFYAHILVEFGDLHQAATWAGRAVATDQNCARCHLYFSEVLGEQARRMSQTRAYFELAKIRKELDRAGALDPRLGDVQWGWVRLDLATPAAAGGSVRDAYRHADLLAEIDPVDGHLARATVAEADGHPDRALDEYRAAAAEHPDDPRGSFALGQALYVRGDYTVAEAPLAHAEQLNHDSSLYNAYLAAAAVRLGHPERARDLLQQAHRRFPDSRLGDYLCAQALVALHQDSEWARQLLNEYLGAEPEPEQPSLADARRLLASL